MTEDRDWPSIDVLYTEIRDAVARQIDQSRALDAKANFVFGSASLLTAGAVALRNATATAQGALHGSWSIGFVHVGKAHTVNLVLLGALGAFAAVIFCSLKGYWLREFLVTPGPAEKAQTLILKWSIEPPDDTKAMLMKSRLDYDLPENEKHLASKITWTRRSFIALAIETVLLLVMATFQVFL